MRLNTAANHRHVQQSDLPPEQIHTLDPVPKGRLAACVIAFLLGSWMLAVPVALIDQLKDAAGPGPAIVSGIVIALGVAIAGLGGFRSSTPGTAAGRGHLPSSAPPLRLSLPQ